MTAMSSISAGHGSSFLEYQDLKTVKDAWILPEFVRFCLRLELMIQYNVIIYWNPQCQQKRELFWRRLEIHVILMKFLLSPVEHVSPVTLSPPLLQQHISRPLTIWWKVWSAAYSAYREEETVMYGRVSLKKQQTILKSGKTAENMYWLVIKICPSMSIQN